MNLRLGCIIGLLTFVLNSSAQSVDTSFVVKEIKISNLSKTKPEIVFRELTFKVGDTISNWQYQKDQSRRQLINLFLFNEVSIYRDSNIVIVHVVERWYLWPIPTLDYADRNFNQWWLTKDPKRLIYGVKLSWYNIRGRNETFVLDLIMGYTRSLGISYKIPNLNKKMTWGLQVMSKINSNREVWFATKNDKVAFFTDNDKTLIKRSQFEVKLTNRKNFFTYHNFYSGYRGVSVSDTVLTKDVNANYLLLGHTHQQEIYAGYQLVYDRRDFKGFPLKGHLLKLQIESSSFIYKSSSELNTLALKFAYSNYFPMSKKLYGSFFVGSRYYTNKYPQYTNIQALGYGKDYIRGYELKVIDGNSFVLGKLEFKYKFLNKTYFFVRKFKNYEKLPIAMYLTAFADGGTVNNNPEKSVTNSGNVLPNTLLYGTGIGYNLVMFYDYCMRLEYTADRNFNRRFYLSFVASM
jgi:outer membrane protein assembly factor BamA